MIYAKRQLKSKQKTAKLTYCQMNHDIVIQ
jgi:hypothetical protein